MSFQDLPPQTPLYPTEAERYAQDALRLSEAAQRHCRHVIDVPYGTDYWQKLDIYLPRDTALTDAPVMVFAHGGAWTHGYKEWCGLMAPPFVEAGVVFVSVSYRLAPQHKHPMPAEDCAAALGWVVRHIGQHGGDPTRIVVGGHSAGGHLYGLVLTREDVLARHGVPVSSIRAFAPLSSQMSLQFAQRPEGSAEARVHEMLLGDSSQARDASPIAFVHPGVPYTVLGYGSQDFDRIVRGNEAMAQALAEAGCAHEQLVLEGSGHFDTALNAANADDPWVRRMIELLRG